MAAMAATEPTVAQSAPGCVRGGLTSIRSGRVDGSAPRPRRPDIQGLRALAVLLVVVFHAGLPVPGGFTGVDVFFAISGFVITGMLLSDLTSVDRIDLLRFYARRVKRLGPALALMVVTIAALGTIASPVPSQRVGAETGVFASLFSANAYLFKVHTGYFDLDATLNPFLHTWTLAVEEQFYVFFPTLLLVSWWLGRRGRLLRGRSRWAAVVAVSVTIAVSFFLALKLSGGLSPQKQHFAFYGSPTRAWEFGAGALLALLAPWLARVPERLAQGSGALGIAAIGAGAFAIHGGTTFPVMATLLPVVGACALLAAGTATRGGMARLLSVRPAVWIGDLSYSWYLWHWPLIVFAKALWPGAGWAAPTFAGLSLLPSWLSYRYVENPIRFSRRIAGRAVLALVAICIAVPIGACLGLVETSNVLATQSTMRAYQHSQVWHADFQLGCDSPTPLGQRTGGACTWGVPGSRGRVVLIGDSNAGHFTEPVVRAANRAGFETTVATYSACPFVDLSVKQPRYDVDLCRRFYVRSLEALVRLRPSLVVTAARSDRYIGNAAFGLTSPGGGATTHLTDAKAHLWYQGLTSTLRRLSDAGIPVLVVHPIPAQPISVSQCDVIRILTASCASSIARSAADQGLRIAVNTENRAVGTTPGAWVIDFENELCDRDRCASMRGHTLMYRDRIHLSVDGALTLRNEFYRAILARAQRREAATHK
jgi:peptidoglycan/LPS O-acetylase OafA/YrhL